MQAVSIYELIESGDDRFIERCYRLLLGRAPDANGMQHYSRRLADGWSKSRVAKDIARSEEARKRGIVLSHATRYSWKSTVAAVPAIGHLFAPKLSRVSPDEAAKHIGHAGPKGHGGIDHAAIAELHAGLSGLNGAQRDVVNTLETLGRHFGASLEGTSEAIKSLHERLDFAIHSISAALDGIRFEQRRISARLERVEAGVGDVSQFDQAGSKNDSLAA
ncbi:DUF4214 domain-containing protein [Paraburkholderia sprentiae WSM5005]|uniref:DUF4214 domain-containing protein n=1 Tax=Paraburkholderia sprentiae WSM5005 TaxID=754502 RepID=A0A8F4QJT8_9BURK|nr:DUF4214 domain-containing protein [Paraburkholderia sprentiae]QXE07306.1 DUF4214 domain-containing protein [Paraburkholderia sprentiae WSM5005]